MTIKRLVHAVLLFLPLLFTAFVNAQTIQQEKMQALSFMVGNWVGTSKSISEQETRAVPAYQKIEYKIETALSLSIYCQKAC